MIRPPTGLRRRWEIIAVAALAFFVLSLPVFARHARQGSGLRQDLATCGSDQSPASVKIDACTRLAASGRFSGSQLAVILDERGIAYGTGGDYDRALADFNEAIRNDPTLPISFNARGAAYERQNKLDLALADFIEAQRLAPDDPSIAANIALIRAQRAAQTRSLAKATSSDDVKALQQRLAGDGCYAGPIDAQPSPTLDAAIAACPIQEPVLRIETGRHNAPVVNIAADAQCWVLATTSSDKTTRLWSAKDLHLLRTIRVPIDQQNGGSGFQVAISPDGHYVATGGWDAQFAVDRHAFAYVFDATTGVLVARPYGSPISITALTFSPDGRWLAVAGGDEQSGVRVYDTSDWHLAMSDLAFGHKEIHTLSFGADGSLYVAGFDGGLRRYGSGPDFSLKAQVALRGGSQPRVIAVDPRGESVTLGFYDSTVLPFYDAATLGFRSAVEMRGLGNDDVEGVAWSSDGSRLFVAGRHRIQGKVTTAVVTYDRSARQIGEVSVANDALGRIIPCGDGLALSGPGVGLVDRAGKVEWSPLAAIDMRLKEGDAFTISPDARQVRFGLGFAQRVSDRDIPILDPIVFDLSQGTLSAALSPIPGFISAEVSTMPVDPSRVLPHDERWHAFAIEPDRSGFVVASTRGLRGFAPNMSERWEAQTSYETWGINLSADGRIIVAADGDGTIRWHRWSDGKELLALFINKVDKRWVAWTPSGYYMASPGGEDLIGWHVNRGWKQAADFFPASRFRKKFSRPDVVRLVLETLDEDEAIKRADTAAQRKQDNKPLIDELPPIINIRSPAGGTTVTQPEVTIDYAWRSPSGQPVDRISVLIDGRRLKDVGLPLRAPSAGQEVAGSLKAVLDRHDNNVSLIAWSGDRASETANVKLVWTGAPISTSGQHKLYAVIVGVSNYAQSDMALHYAAKDASDFATALAAQKGGYYSDVQTRLVTDRDVTRAHLIQALKWLSQVATSPDDVSVVFLAGHGLTDAKQTYWFLPSDASGDDYDATGVSQDEIRGFVQNIPGKVVWFLDTCHAGSAAKRPAVDINLLVNNVTAPENGGIVAFASSRGREVSVENGTWQNGAFTKALLEGINQGKADLNRDGEITTLLLEFFLERRVQELTDGKQNPVMGRPPEEKDFIIARTSAH